MSKDTVQKYLNYMSRLTVRSEDINDYVHVLFRRSVTKQVENSHDKIVKWINGLNLDNLTTWQIYYTGLYSAQMMHLCTKFGPLLSPSDIEWRGDKKYKSIDQPISCERVVDMFCEIGIKKTDPIVKSFHNCLDNNGEFDSPNRFATIEEFGDFNKTLFARIKEE